MKAWRAALRAFSRPDELEEERRQKHAYAAECSRLRLELGRMTEEGQSAERLAAFLMGNR